MNVLTKSGIDFVACFAACMVFPSATIFLVMRNFWIGSFLAITCFVSSGFAQNRVAEGQYEMRVTPASGPASSNAMTRWSLLERASGGYRLQAEILGNEVRARVFQVEELNKRLVPTMVGYEVYGPDGKQVLGSCRCEFVNDFITCRMLAPKPELVCKPFQQKGPFWLWIEDLFVLDMAWLIDGAVNMAHLKQGTVPLATVTVAFGGKDGECDLSSEEEGPLEFVETASFDLAGTKISARHYTLHSGKEPMDLWITEGGILLKMTGDDGGDIILTNYKQYKELIPGFPVKALASPRKIAPILK